MKTHISFFLIGLQAVALQTSMAQNVTIAIDGKLVGITRPWTPVDSEQCELWLDAADESTIVPNGSGVEMWQDKSGNGNHATQSNPANQPLTGVHSMAGRNAIDFDAAENHYLNIPNLGAATSVSVFLVVKRNSDLPDGDHDSGLWHFGDTGSGETRYPYRMDRQIYDGFASTEQRVTAYSHPSFAWPKMYHVDSTPDYWTSDVNLNVVFPPSAGNTVSLGSGMHTLGKSQGEQYFEGQIAECVIYKGDVSADLQARTEAYLIRKWGLMFLPVGHPYEFSVPMRDGVSIVML